MSKSADSNTEKPDSGRRVVRAETGSLSPEILMDGISPEMLKRPHPAPPPDKTPPKKESK